MTAEALAKTTSWLTTQPARTRTELASSGTSAPEPAAQAVLRFLRGFQVLLASARLYQKNHPRLLESLDVAERALRAALELVPSVTVNVDHDTLVLAAIGSDTSASTLPDHRDELNDLAKEFSRCGIHSMAFLPGTNLGELDTVAQLMNSHRQTGGGPRAQSHEWPAWLAECHISGIRINTPLEHKVDAVLSSLLSALLVYGGTTEPGAREASATSPGSEQAEKTEFAATLDELISALRLLARLAIPVEQARQSSPQEAARALHEVLAQAERRTVTFLVAAMTCLAPREGETFEPYLVRLTDALALEFAAKEFREDRLAPPKLRALLAHLAGELTATAVFSGASPTRPVCWLAEQWADEAHLEHLYEAFWSELTPQEISCALRARVAWCVPVPVLRRYLEQRADADSNAPEGESLHEARQALLSYARCLESEDGNARRTVAAGLAELHPLVERLWAHQLPQELSQSVVRTLGWESSPGIAGLLAAVTENLARLALAKSDYIEFERILDGLERTPRDPESAHLIELVSRIVADERWLLLVDAALSSRPLDPALPRLLRRDPGRLLDRLALLLTSPEGLDAIPVMTRLLRAIGEPAIAALEARLTQSRRQRATAAVKLLAATHPERLLAAVPRSLPGWGWHLQDLAVSELTRANLPGTALAFTALVREAHPMVVPMMVDQIGLAQETVAVPLLMEIAAGRNERLRDVFIRIKAVEALGRMRAGEAVEPLHAILRQRHGLTHSEPAGLRAAADEALALIQNRPSSARVRAAYEALEKASLSYARPRRYLRVPLSSPLPAEIDGSHAGPARVRTISLGGAFLESNQRLAVGDSVRVEIRTGLRRIQGTAVVRNISANGGGVEFVHMTEDDREKLRRLVRRLSR